MIALEKQSWEAWKNHDSDFFDRFLSNDHMELGFGGRTSKEQVVKGVASGVCQVEAYSLKDSQLPMLGMDTALLTYDESQITRCQGKPVSSPCWVSSLYIKRYGRWLNMLYKQTTVAK
ncbi:MAG TPA: nuclear transport factor 2 family protein [Chthoniobacterales bacterium]